MSEEKQQPQNTKLKKNKKVKWYERQSWAVPNIPPEATPYPTTRPPQGNPKPESSKPNTKPDSPKPEAKKPKK